MINGRSTSSNKACHASAAHVSEQSRAVKFAYLHEEDDDGDEAVYRVKQNPEKACRVSTIRKSVMNNQQKYVCNKCGKAFQSSKAMCGHMACHSLKERPLSNVGAKRKLRKEMESDSNSEYADGLLRMRLRRIRYKKQDCVADAEEKLDVVNNCSSEASGVEQEQEEVAICLMMLSRDFKNSGGLNLVGGLSDNNSVVLEDKSVGTKLGKQNGSSSGYVRNDEKNVETDVKVRSWWKNKFEKEPHLSLNKLKCLMDVEGNSQIQRPKNALSYPRKGVLNESGSTGMYMRVEHKTPVLTRSHQPFNVNVASNKHFTAAYPYASRQNSFETDVYDQTRRGKGMLDDNLYNSGMYDYPVCSKNFGSEHELGYHWKVHLAAGFQDIKCEEIAGNPKRKGRQCHEFIDLNLPAPMDDEEANESMGSY